MLTHGRRLLLLVTVLLLAGAPAAHAGPVAPRSVGGGTVADPTDAPWVVVYDSTDAVAGGRCTGSIIDATHVLLAAHCVFQDGPPFQKVDASTITVTAGTNNTSDTDGQARGVTQVRVFPTYRPGYPSTDIAMLTVKSAFDLSGAKVKAIAVAKPGTSPPVGTVLRSYGWGQSSPGKYDGREHTLDLTVQPQYACFSGVAALLCSRSDKGEVCPGDSGGPAVSLTGTPVLYGVLSVAGVLDCAGADIAGFSDVTSPSTVRWLAGADDVGSPPYLAGNNEFGPPETPGYEDIRFYSATGQPDVIQAGLPGTCTAAPWIGAASEAPAWIDETGRVAATGASYTPGDADVGHRLACVSTATSANGTTQATSGAYLVGPRLAPSLAITVSSSGTAYVSAPPALTGQVTLTATDQRGRAAAPRVVSGSSIPLGTLASGVYQVCVSTPIVAQYAAARQCAAYTRHGLARTLARKSGRIGGTKGSGARRTVRLAVATGLVGKRVTLKYRFTRKGHKARTISRRVTLKRSILLRAPTARRKERVVLSFTAAAVSVGGVPYDKSTFIVSLGTRK